MNLHDDSEDITRRAPAPIDSTSCTGTEEDQHSRAGTAANLHDNAIALTAVPLRDSDRGAHTDLLIEKYEICRGLFYLSYPSGQHCVYALLCEDGSLYVGQTANLPQRFREHRAGRAAQWTRRHKPLRIAYVEPASSRQEAMQLEYQRKKTSEKRRLKRQIQSENERLHQAVEELAQAFAQAPDHPQAGEIRADLEFFLAACAAKTE